MEDIAVLEKKRIRREYHRAWMEKNLDSQREKRRAWYHAHKNRLTEQRRRHRIKLRYGITEDQYREKFKNQGGACAICKKTQFSKEGPHIDHDHATGMVRDILCGKCNRMIGFALEDISILCAAIEYIKKWKP